MHRWAGRSCSNADDYANMQTLQKCRNAENAENAELQKSSNAAMQKCRNAEVMQFQLPDGTCKKLSSLQMSNGVNGVMRKKVRSNPTSCFDTMRQAQQGET